MKAPKAPQLDSNGSDSSSLCLRWDPFPRAFQYDLRYRFRHAKGSHWGEWLTIGAGLISSRHEVPVRPNALYSFQIRAETQHGWTPWSPASEVFQAHGEESPSRSPGRNSRAWEFEDMLSTDSGDDDIAPSDTASQTELRKSHLQPPRESQYSYQSSRASMNRSHGSDRSVGSDKDEFGSSWAARLAREKFAKRRK